MILFHSKFHKLFETKVSFNYFDFPFLETYESVKQVFIESLRTVHISVNDSLETKEESVLAIGAGPKGTVRY